MSRAKRTCCETKPQIAPGRLAILSLWPTPEEQFRHSSQVASCSSTGGLHSHAVDQSRDKTSEIIRIGAGRQVAFGFGALEAAADGCLRRGATHRQFISNRIAQISTERALHQETTPWMLRICQQIDSTAEQSLHNLPRL